MAESCTEIKLPITTDNEEDRRVLHLIQRSQWLRAAILGANDGLLSTTSLMLGVGAAKDDQRLMIISGLAGALAGACSMAVGEFVSVSTQRDIQQTAIDHHHNCKSKADHDQEKDPDSTIKPDQESFNLANSPAAFVRQSSPHVFTPPRSPFMKIVARDNVRTNKNNNPISQEFSTDHEEDLPNPYKAAGASGLAFLCGSMFPLLSAMVSSDMKIRSLTIVVVTSVALAVFGGVGARLGGSPVRVSALRVLFGGWVSMAVTYALLKPLDRDHD